MTFDLMRLSLEGTFVGGEAWSVNPIFRFGDFEQPDPTIPQMNAAALAAAAVDPGVNMSIILSTACQITGVRLEARKLNGDLVIVGEANRPTPFTGTTTPKCPTQTSVVQSLRSERAGGRGRGRLYWPALGASLTSSTMRWDTTQRNGFGNDAKTYWSAVGGALGTALGLPSGTLAVWSRAGGFLTNVNRLQVGDVLDTQRRRRDAYPESYQTVTYP